MPNVPPTLITTDSPGSGELNLSDGFAIFPWLGAIRAGADLNKGTGTFIDKTLNFEFLKIYTGIFHTTFIGVCGPSYATEIQTDTATSYEIPSPGQPASATLVLDDHDLRGGFQYGVDFQIDCDFELYVNLIFKKKKVLDVDAAIDIDVIELIKDLVEYLLANGGGGQAEGDPNDYEMSTFSESGGPMQEFDIDEGTGGTGDSSGRQANGQVRPEFSGSGMVDFQASPWLPGAGQTQDGPPSGTLEPNFAIDFSIVPLFADIPFLDIIYGIDEGLQAFGGGFGLGPGLTIGLPVTVTLKGATIDNHPFDVDSASGGNGGDNTKTTLALSEQTPVSPNLQPLKQTPDEIGVLLEHKVGLEIGLFFFAEFTFLKVFHVGAQTGTLPLIDVPLPPAAGGPFQNHLSFVPGGGEVPWDAPDTAPTVGPYTANQPQGRWQNGVLARYGVSFFDANYETPIGPFSAYDPQDRFFAFPQLSNIETGPLDPDTPILGRNIYRQFNDGSPVELVGTINDNTTTTFTDTSG
jgi:hypothetical protein